MTLAEIDAKLADLTTLGPNWDQEGGKPIKPQALTVARDVLLKCPDKLAKAFHVVPCHSGAVQLELVGTGIGVEIECCDTGPECMVLVCCNTDLAAKIATLVIRSDA